VSESDSDQCQPRLKAEVDTFFARRLDQIGEIEAKKMFVINLAAILVNKHVATLGLGRARALVSGAIDNNSQSAAPCSPLIEIVPPPTALVFPTFATLFPEALCYRVGLTTTFFLRHSPQIHRPQRRPFLYSPNFAARLENVIHQSIAPIMTRHRYIRNIAANRQWEGVNTAEFWTLLSDSAQAAIFEAWKTAWAAIAVIPDPSAGHKCLQQRLASAPSDKAPYVTPDLSGSHLALVAAVLTDFDHDELNRQWQIILEFYEQAHEVQSSSCGYSLERLADRLFSHLICLTDHLAEHLALLAYFCFPPLTSVFVERFISDRACDARHFPLLSWFIEQEGRAKAEAFVHRNMHDFA
jgi:hypothetical protein